MRTVLLQLMAVILLTSFVPHAAIAQGAAADRVTVILILDNSGSMATSDAGNLRFTAARLFASLLDEGDAVGLIVFSTTSQPLTNGLVTLRNKADKENLLRQIQASLPDGYTDMKAAFFNAGEMIKTFKPDMGRLVIVFLTDGKPEIPQPYPAYEQETLDLAVSLGMPVLSIALTPAAQTPFLSRLATETGGTVVPADDASDLLDAYLEVFSQIKDRTVIGSGVTLSPGSASLEIDPALAPYIEKVNFVLSKPENIAARLFNPAGQETQRDDPSISFVVNDPRFTVTSVVQPPAGNWKFQLSGSGSVQARAILRSRLRAEIVSPGQFHQSGQPMTLVVHLIEEKSGGQIVKIIGEAAFSALVTLPDGNQESLDRFYDDGTHGDARANDGDYTRLFVNTGQPGSYTIAVHGWKGVIPVERNARVEVVTFPAIIVDEPIGEYEIRAQPLTIRIHLEGGTPPQLDRGDLIALITAPSGKTHEIALSSSDDIYTANFLPAEDGVYKVQIEAREAVYKGLPYNLTAQASFIVHIIPTLTFQTKEVNLGKVEMAAAQQGMTVPIAVLSASQRAELVDVELEDAPGLALADNGPFSISPSGESVIHLQLVAQPGAVPGAAAGRLVFTTQQNVDLLGAEIPLRLELFQPSLRVTSTPLRAEIPSGCFNNVGKMTITFALDSAQPETIKLKLEGVEELRLSPQTLQLSAGEQGVALEFLPKGDALPVGEYDAILHVEGRDGLAIYPEAGIPLHLVAPSLLVRCRRPIAWGGILLLSFLVIGLVIARKIKAATRPPLVTGTLRYWPVERGSGKAAEEDLTAFKKTTLVIGHGETCDLSLPDLDEQHAILGAEKSADEVEVLLEPLGEVRKGYGLIHAKTPLRHGDTFRMGNYEFQYLSDKGE